MTDVEVTGGDLVGGLVASNLGTVKDVFVSGSVTGNRNVGGLVGRNGRRSIGVDILAPIIDSYSLSDAG